MSWMDSLRMALNFFIHFLKSLFCSCKVQFLVRLSFLWNIVEITHCISSSLYSVISSTQVIPVTSWLNFCPVWSYTSFSTIKVFLIIRFNVVSCSFSLNWIFFELFLMFHYSHFAWSFHTFLPYSFLSLFFFKLFYFLLRLCKKI